MATEAATLTADPASISLSATDPHAPAGAAYGALALYRPLQAGPLNHDQPAIAQALVTELAARAAVAP